MCGPYGHGWYVAETDTILEKYMEKNAHAELRPPIVLARRDIQPGEEMGPEDLRSIFPIPYGIIPDTGEVVVQNNRMRVAAVGGWQNVRAKSAGVPALVNGQWTKLYYDAPARMPPDDLSGRAKGRIRATWDIAVPTIAQLCRWIEAHYGKRGDAGEWIWQAPRLLCDAAQRRFFPAWHATDQGYVHGYDDPAPHLMAEGQDHRRICEALRRGGANAFWKEADHEDRASKAELVLAEN